VNWNDARQKVYGRSTLSGATDHKIGKPGGKPTGKGPRSMRRKLDPCAVVEARKSMKGKDGKALRDQLDPAFAGRGNRAGRFNPSGKETKS
jgi:hypothetical protein